MRDRTLCRLWPLGLLVLPLVLPLGLAACGGETPPAMMPMPPVESAAAAAARTGFFAALNGSQYTALPDVIATLAAVYDDEPKNPVNTLLLGHAHLWKLAEHARDPNWGMTDSIVATVSSLKYLSEAADLDASDLRIPAWIDTVNVAAAFASGNPTMAATQADALVYAAHAYPEVNPFMSAALLCAEPASSPYFATSLHEMWLKLTTCSDGRLGEKSPDLQTSYPEWSMATERNRHCWQNSDKIPHHFEGMWLSFGDILVKANQPELAKAFYKNAQASPDYAGWSYRAMLEDRLATADARAALYLDSDATNDPELLTSSQHQCVACHAR